MIDRSRMQFASVENAVWQAAIRPSANSVNAVEHSSDYRAPTDSIDRLTETMERPSDDRIVR